MLAARFANLALYKRRNYIPRKLHCPHSVQTTTKCLDSCRKVDQQDQLRNASKFLSPTIRCSYHTRSKSLDFYPSLCDFFSPSEHVYIYLNTLEVDKGLGFVYMVKIDKRLISLFTHEKFEVTPKYLYMHYPEPEDQHCLVLLVMTCTISRIGCYSTYTLIALFLLALNLWTE